MYKSEIKNRKYEYNQSKQNAACGDMKRTWNVLNSILNKNCCEITYIKDGDNEYEDDEIIAEKFTEYFVHSIAKLNSEIPNIPKEHNTHTNTNTNTNTYYNTGSPRMLFKFRGVSINMIKEAAKELKNTTDEYFINSNVLLDSIFVIGHQLADVINSSFNEGVFPSMLRRSTILCKRKVELI